MFVDIDYSGHSSRWCLAGAAAVSQALKEHTNERLAELDLGYNEIKDEGACAVAQVHFSL